MGISIHPQLRLKKKKCAIILATVQYMTIGIEQWIQGFNDGQKEYPFMTIFVIEQNEEFLKKIIEKH